MPLSNDLISQFVKITKDDPKKDKETIAYGEVAKIEFDDDDNISMVYVRLDGAAEGQLTPLSRTTDVMLGDRVIVMIKNHTAVITGNITSPSARTKYVKVIETKVIEAAQKIAEFDYIVANQVTTDMLAVEQARITSLEADNVEITKSLNAHSADITNLQADNVEINESLIAASAEIDKLKTDKIDVKDVEATYAKIQELEALNAEFDTLSSNQAAFKIATINNFAAVNASIEKLQANQIDVTSLEAKFANIDFSNIDKAAIEYFYSTSGLIEDVTVGDGTITGRLVGVTIVGDLIEGGTVKADKLVIKGTDGLYYKLNTDGVKTEAEQTEYNSINGNVILAKSITASKIKVTDLVAFGATIGGIHISDGALYSGAKTSASNTTSGFYLDKDGQIVFGDASNFVKFYKDTDGSYKLDISADRILFGSNSRNIETVIDDVKDSVDNIEVGGRNLLLKSATKQITPYLETSATIERGVEVPEWLTTEAIRMYGTGGTATIFGTIGGTSCHGAADENREYSATIYVKNNHSSNTVTITGNHLSGVYVDVAPLEEKKVELIGFGNGWGYLQFNFKTSVAGDDFDITYWHPKIEIGNRPTDWTPAPEDMATADDMNIVETLAENASAKADAATSLIQQLSESISMLVTDGNGTSLMTQTENGWTFSTSEIQHAVNDVSSSISQLYDVVEGESNAIGFLQKAVDDLGVLAEYVKIGTYEGEPCIELGESDSDFKLVITNTRIMFMEGSSIPAYINNQSLHITKAVIEEEIQQGEFVWKARANGNLGLMWKGEV